MATRSTSRSSARQQAKRARHYHIATPRSHFRRPLRIEPLEGRRPLATGTVTMLADSIDFNDGFASLREAIIATNTVLGADTIDFALTLAASGPATILLTHGELRITDSLAINGPGANLLTLAASGNDPTPHVRNRDGRPGHLHGELPVRSHCKGGGSPRARRVARFGARGLVGGMR